MVIVGDKVSDGGESAGAGQVLAADDNRRAEGELVDADHGGNQRAGGEVGFDADGFEESGKGLGMGAVQAGDEADGGVFEGSDDLVEVILGHLDIGVADHNCVVCGGAFQINERANFAV